MASPGRSRVGWEAGPVAAAVRAARAAPREAAAAAERAVRLAAADRPVRGGGEAVRAALEAAQGQRARAAPPGRRDPEGGVAPAAPRERLVRRARLEPEGGAARRAAAGQ